MFKHPKIILIVCKNIVKLMSKFLDYSAKGFNDMSKVSLLSYYRCMLLDIKNVFRLDMPCF